MADRIVTAEIDGVLFKIEVAVGDPVAVDQSLAILESMKMHIPVESTVAGVVAAVLVEEGATIAEGDALFRITV